MPSRRRPLRSNTSSSRPKRRRLNDSAARRSARLEARNRRQNQSASSTPSAPPQGQGNSNSNSNRRRSTRIRQREERLEAERKDQEEVQSGPISDELSVADIAEGIQRIEDDSRLKQPVSKRRKVQSIYEPLSPPQRPLSLVSNDYMSMWNAIELGKGSPHDLRSILYSNDLADFWNGVEKKQYTLQSVEKPFYRSGSRNEKINAFRVHDTELFVFNGTKDGYFGMTNYSQHPFQSIAVRVHQDRTTDIRTTAQRPLHVYTSSYDGTIKILDLTRIPSFQSQRRSDRGLFGDVVVDNDSVKIHGFDIKNGGREILGVDDNGMLLHCDLRTHSNYEYQIAEKKVAAIRVHPVNDCYFAITENRHKSLQFWDFRKIGADFKEPVHRRTFARVQHGVNFSSDGTALLSVGRDDYVRVFHDAVNSFYRDEVKIQHWNNTGIWICDFKPVFHPRFSEIVLTGSLKEKGIDVLYLGKGGTTKSRNIKDLNQIKGVHTFGEFHPKMDDYLFGICYEKMVYYVRVPGGEEAVDLD